MVRFVPSLVEASQVGEEPSEGWEVSRVDSFFVSTIDAFTLLSHRVESSSEI